MNENIFSQHNNNRPEISFEDIAVQKEEHAHLEFQSFSPFAEIGLQQAQKFMTNVQDNYAKKFLGHLRYYFSVDHNYVYNKLALYLFPFVRHSWSRKIAKTENDSITYRPPNEDINAPDLYIPLMGFITYILLFAFFITDKEVGFQPLVLNQIAFSTLLIFGTEVLCIKLLFYLFLSKDTVSILDLLSYCGYKFVVLVALILIRSVSYFLYYIAFIAAFFQMAVFMIKTLRIVVPQTIETEHRTIRNYIIGSTALFQGIFLFLLL